MTIRKEGALLYSWPYWGCSAIFHWLVSEHVTLAKRRQNVSDLKAVDLIHKQVDISMHSFLVFVLLYNKTT